MVAQGENYSCTSMHSPKQHSDPVFRCFCNAFIPKIHLPVYRPALNPERCLERSSIRLIALLHTLLKMMSGYQFMLHCSFRKMRVVPTHAHHFFPVPHRVCWIRDDDLVTT